jgi:hypothetical protein
LFLVSVGQLGGTSESRRKRKEAAGNRRICRHTGRLVTEEIEMLKVVLYLVKGKR